MRKIETKKDALNKINEIRKHPNVEIASFYQNDKTPWIYYYSLSGWFNGNYFSLYLNQMHLDSENLITEIEIVRSVSEKINDFRKQFKLPYNGKKKTN